MYGIPSSIMQCAESRINLFDNQIKTWMKELEYQHPNTPAHWILHKHVEELRNITDHNSVDTPYGKVYGNQSALKYIKELINDDTRSN